MATVTANLTTLGGDNNSLADVTTGWVGGSGQLDTEVFKQGTGAYTYQTNKNALSNCTFTPTTNENMTANYAVPHLYWTMRCDVFPFCELLNTGATNSGLMVRVTDGAGNFTQWHVAGKDTWDGSWKNWVLDLTNTANIHSSSGTLSLADVDIITWYTDNSNSGQIRIIDNTWIDSVRYGEGLIASSAGTTPFSFQDIADSDAATSNYYGVLQETDGVLFCQGSIIIGDSADVNATNFVSSGETVYFVDRIVDSDHYGLIGKRTVGATNATDVSITSLVCKTNGLTGAEIDFSDSDISSLAVDKCTFIDMGAVSFGSGTLSDTSFNNCGLSTIANCTVTNGTWNSCDQISHSGTTTFNGSTFIGGKDATGAITSADPSKLSNCSFFSDGTGHGLEITATGSFAFSGNVFDNVYSTTSPGTNSTPSSGSTDAMIYNNSGGAVTLTISSGGTTPTVRNAASSTTTIISASDVTLTGMKDNTEVRVYLQGTTTAAGTPSGIEVATAGTTDNRSFTFSITSGTAVDIRVFAEGWEPADVLNYSTSVNATIPISQKEDRVYFNPV